MVRETPNHGWEVQEANDEDYAQIFERLIEDIDAAVVRKGPINQRPPAGTEDRVYIGTDEDPLTLYYDDGNTWHPVTGKTLIPDEVPRRDSNETITEQWEFDEDIIADIDGTADRAFEAEVALHAENAEKLNDRVSSVYARRNKEENIQGEWTYEEETTFEKGVTVNKGTIDLPLYNGSDPPAGDRQRGSMWFREDHQPNQ